MEKCNDFAKNKWLFGIGLPGNAIQKIRFQNTFEVAFGLLVGQFGKKTWTSISLVIRGHSPEISGFC